MLILPLDHPEPFAATLGVMLYPGDDDSDRRKARAYASRFLAEPLRRFHEKGETLTYDELLRIATDAGGNLEDLDERWWGGSQTGEVFKTFFALFCAEPALASWENATRIAVRAAAGHKVSGSRSALWKARSRFQTVAHLWAAWSIRERQFVTQPETGYDGYDDFQSFLAEAEILRQWGQLWRHKRSRAKPPLQDDVWRVPDDWQPPARQPGWPDTGKVPKLALPEKYRRELRPAGRPGKRA